MVLSKYQKERLLGQSISYQKDFKCYYCYCCNKKLFNGKIFIHTNTIEHQDNEEELLKSFEDDEDEELIF